MSFHSHDAFTRRLTTLLCWTSVHFHGTFWRGNRGRGGKCLPFAPWEPNRVPVPRHSLGPIHWVDPDAAGVWMGTADEREGCTAALIDRGQDEVGIHISWLQPTSSLLFISLLCSYSAPSILSSFLLMPAMFYVVCRDGVGLHGEPTVLSFKSGSLPHLCWAFNELFYSQRLNLNHNL